MPPTEACPKCNARVPAGSRFCQVCGAHMTGAKHKGKKHYHGRRQGKTWLAACLVLVLVAGAVAIAANTFSGGSSGAFAATPESLKLMEDMAGPMPGWLTSASSALKTEYAWAADHYNVLQYFPCYCGCYDNAGHESNFECYFQADGNGQISAYDQHAYG